MLSKKNLLFFIANFAVLAILTSIVIYDHFKLSHNEIYVVDNNRLFNEFKMTVESKKNGSAILNKINFRIDSLQFAYQSITDESVKRKIYDIILQEKQNAVDFDRNFSGEETGKIWGRLNDYIKEFSESGKYPVILGSGAGGSVMYSTPGKDITNELIQYTNKRYEGFK